MKTRLFNPPQLVKEIAGLFIGIFIYALGIHIFTSPNDIAPGGVTGIATLLNSVFGWHIGTTTLFINIPLLILSIFFLGKEFTIRTLSAVGLFTIMMDYVVVHFPIYEGGENAKILAALFGGILIGVGLGLVFMSDFTTGGTDILIRIIQLKFPYYSTGKLFMLLDFIVVAMSIFVYSDIDVALYAIIAIFVSSMVVDAVIYGADIGRLLFIVSDKSHEIADLIMNKIDRGVTLLDAKGAYTGAKKEVILIAVKRNQFYKVKKLVYSIDPTAFMIVTDAGEIVGEGFKNPNEKQK